MLRGKARRRGSRRLAVAAISCAAVVLAFPVVPAGAQLPDPQPPGANDFSCSPPDRHPYPVVMLHGTGGAQGAFSVLSPQLRRLGYCPFSFTFARNGTGPIEGNAEHAAAFIDLVLEETGAEKVAVVGHSQGGIIPRYVMSFLGGEEKVAEVVGIAPPNQGTTSVLTDLLGPSCPACAQQKAGSEFMTRLNAGDMTPGTADYTQLATRLDWQVVPWQASFLPEEPGTVTNVLVQWRCPLDLFEHITLVADPVGLQWVLHALGRPGPADPTFRPDCTGLGLLRFPDSSSVG